MSEGSAAENQRERPEQPDQQDQAGAAGENAGVEGVLPVELIESDACGWHGAG